jgi:hypothetical protein
MGLVWQVHFLVQKYKNEAITSTKVQILTHLEGRGAPEDSVGRRTLRAGAAAGPAAA